MQFLRDLLLKVFSYGYFSATFAVQLISLLKLLFFLMMPLKRLTLFLLLVSTAGFSQSKDPSPAPDPELQKMMSRRADLLQQWRRFNLEENALFGGQSKKDLRNIAQVQQKIIALDNQILNHDKLESYTKKKDEKKEALQLRKSLYGRLDSVEALKSRFETQITASKKRESTFKAAMERQQSKNKGLSIALVLVTALLLLSLFYNPLRKKGR